MTNMLCVQSAQRMQCANVQQPERESKGGAREQGGWWLVPPLAGGLLVAGITLFTMGDAHEHTKFNWLGIVLISIALVRGLRSEESQDDPTRAQLHADNE